jgi:hypothetical protein
MLKDDNEQARQKVEMGMFLGNFPTCSDTDLDQAF